MKVKQIYTGCLAQGAYYIESQGEAAVIDPLREPKPYIDRAVEDQAEIKYIFETHFHADFVSGHVDLARRTGARIVYGPRACTTYPAHIAREGEVFKIGEISLTVIHTPGHTLESTTYLLKDAQGKDRMLFTGDTLFIGEVGRPDLAADTSINREHLAGLLYDSLREKILPFSDDLIIYPAHGAGSACGKNISRESFDTLGNQRKNNYALQPMSKEAFIAKVLDGLPPPPAYFFDNVKRNKEGYESLDQVLDRGMKSLTTEEFEFLTNRGNVLILDTRSEEAFIKAHIPQSIFIGLDGSFAPWVGTLIPDLDQPIVLIAPEGREEEAVIRLARVGYDYTLGYLKGGVQAWIDSGKTTSSLQSISAQKFAADYKESSVRLLDVRREGEFKNGHIEGAIHFPLDRINESMSLIQPDQPYYLHCAGGYRSVITASILKARGFDRLINIEGGFSALQKQESLYELMF